MNDIETDSNRDELLEEKNGDENDSRAGYVQGGRNETDAAHGATDRKYCC